ncbi:cysteine-rich receptor protein kinase [Trifolium repens]|nr:cysteine-rich receptor protein kinase [Trifolium repens]
MSGVTVATSVNSFMFHTEVLNFNQSEKRYGLAQCTRDISRKDCRRCLDGQLDIARNGYENKKRWATFGYNCLMCCLEAFILQKLSKWHNICGFGSLVDSFLILAPNGNVSVHL